MESIDFPTSKNIDDMAAEITGLKATLSFVLKAIGQADGGKIIINMEQLANTHENEQEAAVFKEMLSQMRHAFRQ